MLSHVIDYQYLIISHFLVSPGCRCDWCCCESHPQNPSIGLRNTTTCLLVSNVLPKRPMRVQLPEIVAARAFCLCIHVYMQVVFDFAIMADVSVTSANLDPVSIPCAMGSSSGNKHASIAVSFMIRHGHWLTSLCVEKRFPLDEAVATVKDELFPQAWRQDLLT